MTKRIPNIGTLVSFNHEMIEHMGSKKTPVYRIKYQATQDSWESANGKGGFILFLNSEPSEKHNFLRVTSIIKTGNGAWADPVTI